EASKGSATVARYVREGVEVLIATCTGGERGSILNPAMDRPDVIANLAGIRHQEMERAMELLGAHHAWLGFVDSGLPEGDPLPPAPVPGVARRDGGRGSRVAVLRAPRAVGRSRRPLQAGHDSGAVRGLLRRAGPGADRPRDTGRPQLVLVRLPARGAAACLADR